MKYISLIVLFCSFHLCVHGQGLRGTITDSNDPNLDLNWKWYENKAVDLYYNGQNGVVKINKIIELPFFKSGHDLNANLEFNQADMYPEDGWMLFCRDFGTPTRAPSMPFFILYNKYRAILRVIFYNSHQLSFNLFKAELSFASSSQSAAIFTFTDLEKPFLNEFDQEKSEAYLGKVAMLDSWGYADFTLFGYDPALNKNAWLKLSISGVQQSSITLNSTEFTLDQKMDEGNISGSNNSGNFKNAINSGVTNYKNINKAIEGVKKESKRKSDQWWAQAAGAIVNSGIASFAGGIGGIAGFVKSFFFSSDKSAQRLQFEGSIKFEGEITGESPILNEHFSLNPNATLSSQYYRVLQDIPIGIFNLVNRPKLYHTYHSSSRKKSYALNVVNMDRVPELSYVFNEKCGLEMTSMKIAYTFQDRAPSNYYEPEIFTRIGHTNTSNLHFIPDAISIELKFRIKNNNKEMIVYKVYPFGDNYEYIGERTYNYGINKINVLVYNNDINITTLSGMGINHQYHVALGYMNFLSGFNVNSVDYLTKKQFIHFISEKGITMSPDINLEPISNKWLEFYVADFKRIQLRSSNESSNYNSIELILKERMPELFDELNFRNLQMHYDENQLPVPTSIDSELWKDRFEVQVSPNPVKEVINFQINSEVEKTITLMIYGESGSNLFINEYKLNPGDNTITLNTSDLNLDHSRVLIYKISDKYLNVKTGKIMKH